MCRESVFLMAMEIENNDSTMWSCIFRRLSKLSCMQSSRTWRYVCTLFVYSAHWLSVYSVMHKGIVFSPLDLKLPCCPNTESQRARLTGSVKWRVMTPVQRRGLVEMTLKHGTTHCTPVKCLKKKKAFFCSITACCEMTPPPRHTHTYKHTYWQLSCLPFHYTVVVSVHVTCLSSATALLSKAMSCL